MRINLDSRIRMINTSMARALSLSAIMQREEGPGECSATPALFFVDGE